MRTIASSTRLRESAMSSEHTRDREHLRERAEQALRRDRPRPEVQSLLEQLLACAPAGSDDATFAHRHLAECRLEREPWRAALHLRQVMRAGSPDDMVHALMGLCQALLGNFDSAVVHYLQAVAYAPNNPWYRHNLGHLLDVALDLPHRAEPHLREAHEGQPLEDEVTASLAHCLARCGKLDESIELAMEASQLCPGHAEHHVLLEWLEKGAPGGKLLPAQPPGSIPGPASRAPIPSVDLPSDVGDEADLSVLTTLDEHVASRDEDGRLRVHARQLWDDFRARCPRVRVVKPETYAAALEYAVVAHVQRVQGATQSHIAGLYGISPAALSSRYAQIRDAVALRPGDPRYIGG